YSYHVGQFTTSDGKTRSTQLLEEARNARRTYRLETTFALAPGTRLTLADHPNDAMNGGKLVVRARTILQLDGTGSPVGSHVLDCVDASDRYRPRRGPKPRILGTQTAFVVGKRVSEDEIDVDKYGRVKVHFTWDRRDSSFEGKPTRFIRVSQGWAGQGYGFVMLPRVGDEVIVSYLDGDPDEPIIIGRVHNAVYTSPLNLTSSDDFTVSMWKSCSSPKDESSSEDRFNLVRMQDKAGEEMLELRAQRDFRHRTLHDYAAEVGHNQSVKVTGSQSTSAGSISASAGTTYSMSAGTSMSATAGASMSLHAGDGLTEVSDTTVAIAAGTTMGLSSGASMSFGSGENIDMSASATWTAQATDVCAKAEGTATVTGAAVILVATGDLSAHGKGSAALTSGSTSTVNAPTIIIDGGTINIKGGTVNINC
ncbi:MAG: type VI secretion system tip protein TssI/VgrG, partial [Byssovorax sp.]